MPKIIQSEKKSLKDYFVVVSG
jgi:hypothetical protein